MASFFTKEQQDEIERRITTAIGIQSDTFGKLMNSCQEQATEMKSVIEIHNQELHQSSDSVRRLVEEQEAKAAAIVSSMARIAEAETRLASVAADIEVFAATQDNAI